MDGLDRGPGPDFSSLNMIPVPEAPAGGGLAEPGDASMLWTTDSAAAFDPSEVASQEGGARDRAVRVAVRLRPPLRAVWDRDPKGLVTLDPVANNVIAVDAANRLQPAPVFHFDAVFGQDAAQTDIYDNCVAPLVAKFLQGYNATVMAYGQTGSGKTHTMGREDQDGDQLGMLQRAIQGVFQAAGAMQASGEAEVELRVQFVEIYNEEVRDLLDPTFDHRLIRINERPEDGTIQVEGVLQEPVSADGFGAARALDLFLLGCQSRVVGTTNLNLRSSRAHAIFTLHMSRRPAAEPGVTYTSKLHVVDLAGSERNKRTKAEGARMKEAISINSGLLVLQKVMAALQQNSRRGAEAREHVPYRESRLTRMLQDSLGSNAFISIIACISGEPADMEETLLTLKYAAGARRIRGAPTVTRKVTNERHIKQLRQRLKTLLTRSAAAVMAGGSVGTGSAVPATGAGATAGLKLLRQLPEDAVWELMLEQQLHLRAATAAAAKAAAAAAAAAAAGSASASGAAGAPSGAADRAASCSPELDWATAAALAAAASAEVDALLLGDVAPVMPPVDDDEEGVSTVVADGATEQEEDGSEDALGAAPLEDGWPSPTRPDGTFRPRRRVPPGIAAAAAARGSVGMSLGTWLGSSSGGGARLAPWPSGGCPEAVPACSGSSGAGSFSLPCPGAEEAESVESPQAFKRPVIQLPSEGNTEGGPATATGDGEQIEGGAAAADGGSEASDGDSVDGVGPLGGPRVRRARDPMRCSTAALSALQPPFSHSMAFSPEAEDESGVCWTTPGPSPLPSPGTGGMRGLSRQWSDLPFDERMAVLERCCSGEEAKTSAAAGRQAQPKTGEKMQAAVRKPPQKPQQQLEQRPRRQSASAATVKPDAPSAPRRRSLAGEVATPATGPPAAPKAAAAAEGRALLRTASGASRLPKSPNGAGLRATDSGRPSTAGPSPQASPQPSPRPGTAGGATTPPRRQLSAGVAVRAAGPSRLPTTPSASPMASPAKSKVPSLRAPAGAAAAPTSPCPSPPPQSRSRTPPPSTRGASPPPGTPPAASAPQSRPGTPGSTPLAGGGRQPLSRASSVSSLRGSEGGQAGGTWAPSPWAAAATSASPASPCPSPAIATSGASTPSRIPALRAPLAGGGGAGIAALAAPDGSRLPSFSVTHQQKLARRQIPQHPSPKPSPQRPTPLTPSGSPSISSPIPAASPAAAQSPAALAGVAVTADSGSGAAAGGSSATSQLRRPLSFTSLGGVMGWAAAMEGPNSSSVSAAGPASIPAAGLESAATEPAPVAPAVAAPPTVPTAEESAAAATHARDGGVAAAFERLLGSHLDSVCGSTNEAACSGASTNLPPPLLARTLETAAGEGAAASSAVVAKAESEKCAEQAQQQEEPCAEQGCEVAAALPAAAAAAAEPDATAVSADTAADRPASPSEPVAVAKPSTAAAAPRRRSRRVNPDEQDSVNLGSSDDEERSPTNAAAAPQQQPARSSGGRQRPLADTQRPAAVKAAVATAPPPAAAPAGNAGEEHSPAAAPALPARSPTPGRIEDLISRINAALETRQTEPSAEAAAAAAQDAEAEAARAARVREELDQALLILGRPGAGIGSSAGGLSSFAGSSLASLDGLIPADRGDGVVRVQQRPRGAQRQLAAKLASRLLASGSLGASSAAGSVAGGGNGNGGCDASRDGGGSDSEGEEGDEDDAGSDTRDPQDSAAGRLGGSPWLRLGAREHLAKLTWGAAVSAAARTGSCDGPSPPSPVQG